eukprot:GHVT01070080.1.p1 GENE.GHVT01070080.1~~GHVT01070080.1.p1  ORF type:complete len:141 (-),score=23.77 GHVT01070080.1:877-1299(-)
MSRRLLGRGKNGVSQISPPGTTTGGSGSKLPQQLLQAPPPVVLEASAARAPATASSGGCPFLSRRATGRGPRARGPGLEGMRRPARGPLAVVGPRPLEDGAAPLMKVLVPSAVLAVVTESQVEIKLEPQVIVPLAAALGK